MVKIEQLNLRGKILPAKKHGQKILNSNNFVTKKCVMKNFHGGGWYGVGGSVGGEEG